MSTLVKNIETFRLHVTVNYNMEFEQLKPYVVKAERKFIKPVIGNAQYETLVGTSSSASGTLGEVLILLQEASSNLAMFSYTFVGVVQVSDNGFHISTNQNSTPAEWWQIRDLRRSLLNAGNEAIDEALEIMEGNAADFSDWTSSSAYTIFKEFFVRTTGQFDSDFNIENSRRTFLKLRPFIKRTERKYFEGLLGSETVAKIKAEATQVAKDALAIAQSAQVAFTVAEVANEGAFLFTPNGMFVATVEIPGEKHQQLTEDKLYNLHRLKMEEANALAKDLVLFVSENDDVFTEYASREATQYNDPSHNTGSLLSV
ncbi:hypothetical protein MG296_10575 [Flavobacteriaceae bacterium TK19130]|nr:hypothetical protein [Thermobacterium salinum]